MNATQNQPSSFASVYRLGDTGLVSERFSETSIKELYLPTYLAGGGVKLDYLHRDQYASPIETFTLCDALMNSHHRSRRLKLILHAYPKATMHVALPCCALCNLASEV